MERAASRHLLVARAAQPAADGARGRTAVPVMDTPALSRVR
jgi:hypothetical protein